MSKALLSFSVFLVSFLAPHDVWATSAGKLTAVNVKRSNSGVSIDLNFDRPFSAKNLKPAFERNFVQLVLKATRVDAAKMLNVADSEVQKVFAYPYNLDTARLRVILKQDNAWAKGRLSFSNNNPKSIRVFIKDPVVKAAVAKPAAPKTPLAELAGVEAKLPPSAQTDAGANVEEKSLLKEVVSNTRDIDINNPESLKAALGRPIGIDKISATDKAAATISDEKSGPVGIKADPTRYFTRMALALFGVLALFLGGVLLVKRYAGKLKGLPFGKKERLIQVVATHYLGNKKSISLVKITGEYMVVGVSNDGISLISKLGPEVNVEKYMEDRFWGGTFEKHLSSYTKDTAVNKEIDLSTLTDGLGSGKYSYDGARDLGASPSDSRPELLASVRSEANTLSPLRASIREKLTKLKPLA